MEFAACMKDRPNTSVWVILTRFRSICRRRVDI